MPNFIAHRGAALSIAQAERALSFVLLSYLSFDSLYSWYSFAKSRRRIVHSSKWYSAIFESLPYLSKSAAAAAHFSGEQSKTWIQSRFIGSLDQRRTVVAQLQNDVISRA
jgi:hypothetical protein